MAPPRMVSEAIARIRPFVEGPLGQQIANCREVRSDLPWSTVWDDLTTIGGRLDLAFRDDDGDVGARPRRGWADGRRRHEAPPGALGQARAGLGCGPIARGWIIAHGPGGGLMGEDRFDDAIVAAWLEAASTLR